MKHSKKLRNNFTDSYVDIEMNFGDILVFNKCTFHTSSGINSVEKERRAL